jgi:hypothetical protein
MDCVVSQGVNRRSIPAVLTVTQGKIYAVSHKTFLTMGSGRVGIIHSRSFGPSNAEC